ncbi:MAG: lysozyme inhibitor LprI family protein [Zoogloeaceae bacterium]|jgi:uncharacterized protein|nr:lysozyme inhibitor LprI family protein [Zoogloeaceae bacterium]
MDAIFITHLTGRIDKIFTVFFAVLIILSITSLPTRAASFDCSKAKNEFEQAICGDPKLSALDEELARAYRNALGKMGEDAESLRIAQRAWLKQMQSTYSNHIADGFQHRIKALNNIADFPAVNAPTNTFLKIDRLNDISEQYDFTLRRFNYDATDKEAKQILIHRKGQSKSMQLINVTETGDSDIIQMADWNFDGNKDLYIYVGNYGSHGGAVYDIFLFNPESSRFDYSSELSDMTLDGLSADPKRKVLHTYGNAGCCQHTETIWKLLDNIPLAIEIRDESTTAYGCVENSVGRWENGEWRWEMLSREPMKNDEYATCEEPRDAE